MLRLGPAFLIVPAVMFAQVQAGARLFGTVTDPSGSPVPGAQVKITSPATGVSTSVTTNPDGIYVAPQISAGTYDIEVTMTGFKMAKVTGVLLQTNESVGRNIELEVGAVTTAVEVAAQTDLTNNYTAQLSQTVDARRIQDLPLNGRDVTSLNLLVAGATVTDVSTAFYAGTSGFSTTTAIVNGNRSQDNMFLLDGMSNMYMARRVSNIYPSPDAIEEFTLNTAQYSAEMGGMPGAH